jgi:hypothetical protein
LLTLGAEGARGAGLKAQEKQQMLKKDVKKKKSLFLGNAAGKLFNWVFAF